MASFLFRVPQIVDANGDPYSGAKCELLLTGTTTQSAGYSDTGLTTPLTNPVVADSKGLFAPIYLDQAITYKVVLSDADDNTIQTIDPVKAELGTANTAIAGLTPAADKVPYFTSSTAAALADFPSWGRGLVANASEAAFKSYVNLEIGTDVQTQNAFLNDLSTLGSTIVAEDLIVGVGTNDVKRLAKGTNGQALIMTAGAVAWAKQVITGWTLLETQQPETDVSTVTFATDISSYVSVRVEALAEMGTSGAYVQLEYSPDGSTWRTIALGATATQASGLTVNFWEIPNVNDADGSALRIAHNIHTATKTANVDRSNQATNFNGAGIDTQAGTGGYTSYDEAMTYLRLTASSGNIEGSTADRRGVFRLWGQI